MRKMVNNVRTEGYFYNAKMELKTVQRKESSAYGMRFYKGYIAVATNEDCTNIVRVLFDYLPEKYNSGQANRTFGVIEKLMSENECVTEVGKEKAQKISITSSFAENRSFDDTVISGSFISLIPQFKNTLEANRATFEADVLLSSISTDDETDETKIKGYVFNFRNEIIPITFKTTPEGAEYFSNVLGDEQNHFMKVYGILDYMNIHTQETIEGGFGGTIIKEHTVSKKDYIINNSNPDEYDFGDDGEDLTTEEVKTAISNREVKKAEAQKSYEEWKAANTAGGVAINPVMTTTPTSTAGKTPSFADFAAMANGGSKKLF